MANEERMNRLERDVTAHASRNAQEPTVAEEIGEAAGGISGAVTGAAIGRRPRIDIYRRARVPCCRSSTINPHISS